MNLFRRLGLPITILCGLPLLLGVVPVSADWPRFHGPDGQGRVDGSLPDQWTNEDYAWRYPLGSRDVGSIAIADGKAYLLASQTSPLQLALHSVNIETGKANWKKTFPISDFRRHARNSYAASTPTVAEGLIYISYADPNHTWLRCFNTEGDEVWSRDFGSFVGQHGFGTSPSVVDGLVILLNSQDAVELPAGTPPGPEELIAVDAKTGETVWTTSLQPTRVCYGVSAVYRPETGPTQIINASTGSGLFGVDAKSGEKLWQLDAFDKRVVMTPLVIGDLAISSCGSGAGGNYLAAVRIPATKQQEPTLAYKIDRAAPYVPTPAVDGDVMMMVSDNGLASRVRASDGEPIWTNARIGGNFGASPVIIGDKVLLVSLNGVATIIANSDTFEKLGEVDLGAPVGGSPAFSRGKLLIRVGDELRCLALDGQS